jgi:two-component system cell cycle sensor histidine kinase/response regulator CckA
MRNDVEGGRQPAVAASSAAKKQRSRRQESLVLMALGVAHDLNNSMACILGNNKILLSNLSDASPLEENAREVETSANLAADLAKQLTAFSGKSKVNSVALDISEVVRTMAEELSTLARPGVSIHIKSRKGVPSVKASPDQIRIAVCNLVQNAVEFMVDGKGSVTVRTGWIESGEEIAKELYFDDVPGTGRYAYIEVADTGCGMAPDVLDRIFEPFFTTKIRARGMGLSVVAGIVRAHRGIITVKSEPGHGSAFRLLLPCPA